MSKTRESENTEQNDSTPWFGYGDTVRIEGIAGEIRDMRNNDDGITSVTIELDEPLPFPSDR